MYRGVYPTTSIYIHIGGISHTVRHERLSVIYLSEKQIMLIFALEKGNKKVIHVYKISNYSLFTKELMVLDFETVNVSAGIFKSCAKTKIEEIWPWTRETGYVWLGENIGLVK